MTNPTTDLAARFEAKREECLRKAVEAEGSGITASGVVYWVGRARSFLEAQDMARADAAGGADGFVRVPARPTPEMLGAFWRTKNTGTMEIGGEHQDSSDVAAYRAMIEAAPPPPAQQGSSSPLRKGETVGLGFPASSGSAKQGGWTIDVDYMKKLIALARTKCEAYYGLEETEALLLSIDPGNLVPASLATARDGGTGVGETLQTIAQWCEETFGPVTPERVAKRAAEEMEELLAEPTKVEEAADVVIVLSRYPNLWEAVERKMAVNRARKWRLMGDGTGYHVKPEAPTPDPRKEALAVLEGLDPVFTPELWIAELRHRALDTDIIGGLGAAQRALAKADRIEAALATLSATDQAGEVRDV
jgi:hypothetical protein